MLAQCANPGCAAKFRYLHEGKVYVADWVGEADPSNGTTCWRRTEMFWLCGSCCRQFALSKKGTQVEPVKLGAALLDGVMLRELRISR
jgi:hypothetical protein